MFLPRRLFFESVSSGDLHSSAVTLFMTSPLLTSILVYICCCWRHSASLHNVKPAPPYSLFSKFPNPAELHGITRQFPFYPRPSRAVPARPLRSRAGLHSEGYCWHSVFGPFFAKCLLDDPLWRSVRLRSGWCGTDLTLFQSLGVEKYTYISKRKQTWEATL